MRHVPDKFSGLAPRPVERALVGVALDASDEQVLGAAGAIGVATGARLIVVHAAEPSEGVLLVATGGEGQQDARAELASRVERWLPRGVEHSIEVHPGAAHRVLTEVAARTSPSLLVVGAAAAEGRLLGSTAERVLRKSSVPVLVVRGELATPPRRIVAPVDLSELSACGFHYGLGVASRLAGEAELEVVVPFAVGFLDPPSREMRQTRATTDEMVALARTRLDELVSSHLPDVALRIDQRVVFGPAREVILRIAEVEHADLIVMSTHGYGGFERLVLGSVASTVVREATCSVLLVPPEAADRDAMAEAILSQTAPAKHLGL
jgi:nucleotide-binding universal stress UspA family protein